MRTDLFKKYLQYRQDIIPGYIESRIIHRHQLIKKEARAYKKTDAFRQEYEKELAQELDKYRYENAVNDSSIVDKYEKLEPMLAEILDAGLKPNFRNLKTQYSKLTERKSILKNAGPVEELCIKNARNDIKKLLRTKAMRLPRREYWYEEVNERNIEQFTEYVRKNPFHVVKEVCQSTGSRGAYCRGIVLKSVDPQALSGFGSKKDSERRIIRVLADINRQLEDALRNHFTYEVVMDNVFRNPRYAKLRKAYEEKRRIYSNIVEAIPDRIENLYPATRQMERHFTIHIGPTNSGKTHDAMIALRESGNGVYLAPLRLLAYEQYERMNEDGYPCSMITGEEIINSEGASFTASTIEMCSFEQHYACAVIDEAQMVTDKFRGGAWTAAIMGLMADSIHVCAAPEAEQILINMVEMCGDTYEIVRHERMTPLEFEDKDFRLRKDIRPHDACIVFSRKQVHNIASELQRRGHRVSIIYGNLPYSVRHEEARKFAEGENDVLVSTDAIGMGMNLPIRRIVFLETAKFDGESKRELKDTEVKQIAGRAGRFGVFDTGYYTAMDDRDLIRDLYDMPTEDIETLYVTFPRSLLGIEGKLSATIEQWQRIRLAKGIELESTDEMLELAREAEAFTDNKEMVYELAAIPFDIKSEDLRGMWRELSRSIAEDLYPGFELRLEHTAFTAEKAGDDIKTLEECSEQCDLLYNFDRKFNAGQLNEDISFVRTDVSKRIMRILSKQKLEGKTCKYCGKVLPWDYEYSVCEKCHNGLYPGMRKRYGNRR